MVEMLERSPSPQPPIEVEQTSDFGLPHPQSIVESEQRVSAVEELHSVNLQLEIHEGIVTDLKGKRDALWSQINGPVIEGKYVPPTIARSNPDFIPTVPQQNPDYGRTESPLDYNPKPKTPFEILKERIAKKLHV